MAKLNVLIYDGPGVTLLQKCLVETLKSLLSSRYDVIRVDPYTIQTSPWEESTTLFVMPGGADLKFLDALGPIGLAKINEYVRGGGNYLGFCGGSYFACSRVEFEVGRPAYEVIGDRPLKFCPALAQGSVTHNFVYNSELGADALKIVSADGKELYAYCNGAPCFKFDNLLKEKDVEVLYRYELNQEAAILHCKADKGSVFLCGPHLEVSSQYVENTIDVYKSDPTKSQEVLILQSILSKLQPAEESRRALFGSILERMGLELGLAVVQIDQSYPIYVSSLSENDLMFFDFRLRSAGIEQDGYALVKDNLTEFILPVKKEFDVASFQHDQSKKVLLMNFPESNGLFDCAKYLNFRAMLAKNETPKFGSFLFYSKVVGSTQTLIDKNSTFSKSILPGSIFVASHQTSGRGRGNNSWISNSGCLQFSMRIEHSLVSSIIFIQYLFGLAVIEGIQKIPGNNYLPIFLKWPNDIYAITASGLQKIGGILITTEYNQESSSFGVTIGCGINVLNTKPSTCLQDLTNNPIEIEKVLAYVVDEFESLYNELLECKASFDCFSIFRDRYYKRWLHTDQVVNVQADSGELLKMVIKGLDSYGFLKAVLEEDPMKAFVLQPDGNTFDMTKNLITSKK